MLLLTFSSFDAVLVVIDIYNVFFSDKLMTSLFLSDLRGICDGLGGALEDFG